MRTYKPDQTLNASNSKVVGVSINRKGQLTKIRVKFAPRAPEASKVIVKSKELLNPMGIELQRLGI
jgi:hypothetical protein